MSAKWRRSRAWDDRFFPAWAWPAKLALRAMSSIPLAVILLSLVLLYGVLASVPIGLLALAPTWMVVGLTLLGIVALLTAAGVMLARRVTAQSTPSIRFAAVFLATLLAVAVGVAFWVGVIWPALSYDSATGAGFRLFPRFVETYKSTTIRRLPILELTEGEFYSFWPLRVILLLFVFNLATATLRRIEFRFEYLGVLTVHTGIIVLALGSIHYQSLKQEGDVLLLAGAEPGEPGPIVTSFMDRTRPALWGSLDGGPWSASPIPGLPRYNDYGVPLSDRALDITMPYISASGPGGSIIGARVVGFGAYVDLAPGWAPRALGEENERSGEQDETPDDENSRNVGPLVDLELLSSITESGEASEPRVVASLRLPAGSPKDRVVKLGGVMSIEHLSESEEQRWRLLAMPAPTGANAVLVAHPEHETPEGIAIEPGARLDVDGYSITVRSIHPSPPFPIITPGYENAESSVVILDVTPPAGDAFERWIFSRYPELNQDIHGVKPDGRPDRRPADPALALAFLDTSVLQVALRGDEALVRFPAGEEPRIEHVTRGSNIELAPRIVLRVVDRWSGAVKTERPIATPIADRRKDFIGTFDRAAIALELASGDWRTVVWLPFARFMNVELGSARMVELPDGRSLTLAFSRLPRPLPALALRLADFEMIPYPHSDIPRDYLSQVVVTDLARGETTTRTTRLNSPLIHRVRMRWQEDRPAVANLLAGAVSVIAPNRYKFSQAGWDAEGWRESAAQAEAGRGDRPRAAFTILGVGNNPGIHIIAAGGVMVCVGIPWAFYIKPWLLRRRRDRLKQIHAERIRKAPPAARRRRESPRAEPSGAIGATR